MVMLNWLRHGASKHPERRRAKAQPPCSGADPFPLWPLAKAVEYPVNYCGSGRLSPGGSLSQISNFLTMSGGSCERRGLRWSAELHAQ